jgi:phosphatidate cytidylyltransferase
LGELPFTVFIIVLFGIASWEFAELFRAGGFRPSGFLIALGTVFIMLIRLYFGFAMDAWVLPVLLLMFMSYALYQFTRGHKLAANDFVVSVGGVMYVGYMGSYFISTRLLPDGSWWVLSAFFAVMLADTGAYFVGTYLGRHKLAKNLSPKKTWEGYIGGVACAAGIMPLWIMAFRQLGLSADSPLNLMAGMWIGLLLGTLTVFGDFGVSIIKRQFDVKDTGTILPGHGGMLDRVDSWIWAAVLSYFLITLFLL